MEHRKQPLTPEYNAAILGYLLELERTWPRPGDYMKEKPELQLWMWEKLVKWVVELCQELKTSTHTTQLTLTILSLFLSKVKTPKSVLQLVGVVCILITAKFEEGISYTLDHAYNHSAKLYQKKDIITAELYCLEKLEWKLYYPTAAELIRQLVYITGVDYDFSRIISRADDHSMLCYTDYELSLFSPLSVAIISTVLALEQFRQVNFRNQWLQFLYLKIPLRVEELNECKTTLVRKLEGMEGEKARLKHVSREVFSELLDAARTRSSGVR